MTSDYQDYLERLERQWTRMEIRKYEAVQRTRRRRWFWRRHRLAIVGFVALAIAAVALGVLISKF